MISKKNLTKIKTLTEEFQMRLIRKLRFIFKLAEIPKYKITKYLNVKKGLDLNLTENNSFLTIIIPCFNHEKYLEKCFESILKQSKKPDEIIFINDNSKDNTEQIINGLIDSHASSFQIQFINNKKNIGQSESLNLGIANTNCERIMILNDDDYLYPDAISIIHEIFDTNNDIALIGCSATPINNDDQIDEIIKNLAETRTFKDEELYIHKPEKTIDYKNNNDLNMTHSSSSFRKKAWLDAGGYISKKIDRIVNFSDRDFQIRIALLYPVAVIKDTPLAFWRSNSSVDAGINS